MAEVKRFRAEYKPQNIKPISDGLNQVQEILPHNLRSFLGNIYTASLIEIRDYQSPVFVQAGFPQYPDSYGRSDGMFVELVYEDGQRRFIIAQKVSQTPYDILHSAIDGLDLRPIVISAVKTYPDRIEVMNPKGEIEVYTGQ